MITDVRLGDTQAVKMYRGGDVVWERQSEPELPAGYTRCKYIELSGTQSSDSPILFNNSTKYAIDCNIRETGDYQAFFDAIPVNSWPRLYSFIIPSGILNVAENSTGLRFPFGNRVSISYSFANNLSVSVNSYTYAFDWAHYYNREVSLFGRRGLAIGLSGFVYGVMLGNDDEIREYIPAYSYDLNSAGLLCISNGFFIKSAVGKFGYELMDGTYVAPI